MTKEAWKTLQALTRSKASYHSKQPRNQKKVIEFLKKTNKKQA